MADLNYDQYLKIAERVNNACFGVTSQLPTSPRDLLPKLDQKDFDRCVGVLSRMGVPKPRARYLLNREYEMLTKAIDKLGLEKTIERLEKVEWQVDITAELKQGD